MKRNSILALSAFRLAGAVLLLGLAACQAETPQAAVSAATTVNPGTAPGETGGPGPQKNENATTAPASGRVALDLKLPRWTPIGTNPNLDIKKYEPPRLITPIMVPRDVRLLSRNAPVTASDREPIIGSLDLVTDGDKNGSDGSFVELAPGLQWVQLDLGAPREIFLVALWHFHSQARVYYDVTLQCADDPDFVTGVRTLYNNDADNSTGLGAGKDREYIEDYRGKLFDLSQAAEGKPVRTRYLRLTSNGSTANEMNHYIEAEVYGR